MQVAFHPRNGISSIALGVVQSDVKKSRRRIANVDVGTMQTIFGR